MELVSIPPPLDQSMMLKIIVYETRLQWMFMLFAVKTNSLLLFNEYEKAILSSSSVF